MGATTDAGESNQQHRELTSLAGVAFKPGSANARRVIPVAPVHTTGTRIKHNHQPKPYWYLHGLSSLGTVLTYTYPIKIPSQIASNLARNRGHKQFPQGSTRRLGSSLLPLPPSWATPPYPQGKPPEMPRGGGGRGQGMFHLDVSY